MSIIVRERSLNVIGEPASRTNVDGDPGGLRVRESGVRAGCQGQGGLGSGGSRVRGVSGSGGPTQQAPPRRYDSIRPSSCQGQRVRGSQVQGVQG